MDIHLLVKIEFQVNRSFADLVFLLGRIMLNRIIKLDRYIDIDLEQKFLPNTGEYGDSSGMKKTFDNHLSILNQQSNA
jgi:hypothetical protein